MSILKFMWDLLISFDPEQYGLLYGFVRPNGLFKQAFSSGYEQGETVRVVITNHTCSSCFFFYIFFYFCIF